MSLLTEGCSAQSVAGVEVQLIDQTIGRGVFATRQYKEDEVIFEETPLVSCQFLYNKAYGYRACDHCLKSLESVHENVHRLCQDTSIVLPHCGNSPTPATLCCPHCQEAYCSEQCRSTAWQLHHRTLCLRGADMQHPLLQLQQQWKLHHYPPESLNIMLLARLLAGVLQSADPAAANSTLTQFCHASSDLTHTATHKLLGPGFAEEIDTLRKLMAQALGGPLIAQWLTAEGFQSLLTLVGSNGQGVGSSPLALWVTQCDDLAMSASDRDALDAFIDELYERLDKVVGGFLNTEGSGLYRLQSRVNHSCRPNATPSFPNNSHQLSLTAVRDIEAGEQVTISYLDECQLGRSRHSRHKTLSENYVFVCGCERCEDEAAQDDVTSEEEADDEEPQT